MIADLWLRLLCLMGKHCWLHFNRARVCKICGKQDIFKPAGVVPDKPWPRK